MLELVMQEMEQRYFNRLSAAKYLGIWARQLGKLVATGSLKPLRPGGKRMLFVGKDLDDFMSACK
jgi:excisionase family DNA binding protein